MSNRAFTAALVQVWMASGPNHVLSQEAWFDHNMYFLKRHAEMGSSVCRYDNGVTGGVVAMVTALKSPDAEMQIACLPCFMCQIHALTCLHFPE